jgi:hypothetical protein
MAKELALELGLLKAREGGKDSCSQMAATTLDRVHCYLNDPPLMEHLPSQSNYEAFCQSLDTPYQHVLELTHKLHWFGQVAAHLKAEAVRLNERGDQSPLGPSSPIHQISDKAATLQWKFSAHDFTH